MTFDYELLKILDVDEVESLLKSNKIPINDRHKINFWLGIIRMRTMGSIIGKVVGASLILYSVVKFIYDDKYDDIPVFSITEGILKKIKRGV